VPLCIEPAQKIISWKRTESSQSASMRNPLVKTSETYMDDSGSDFVEEPCMISGSHSCTLERLYAWERKLYDEVKVITQSAKICFTSHDIVVCYFTLQSSLFPFYHSS